MMLAGGGESIGADEDFEGTGQVETLASRIRHEHHPSLSHVSILRSHSGGVNDKVPNFHAIGR